MSDRKEESRKYYLKNKERIKTYQKRRRIEKKDQNESYQEKNRVKKQIYDHNRKAIKLGMEGQITLEEWHQLLNEHKTCYVCGYEFSETYKPLRPVPEMLHDRLNDAQHIIPVCLGCSHRNWCKKPYDQYWAGDLPFNALLKKLEENEP